MDRRKYGIVAINVELCLFYLLKGIMLYVELGSNYRKLIAIMVLVILALLFVQFVFKSFPVLTNVSSLCQNTWAIIKLSVFVMFIVNLKYSDMIIYSISLFILMIFLSMQIYFHVNRKFVLGSDRP